MELNGDELIKDMLNGDKSAMEAIFNIYVHNSVKLAYLITGEWGLAEDAVQEAFIRAFAHIKSFDRNKKFKPWFTKIVVNEARRAKKNSGNASSLETIPDLKIEEETIEDKVVEELNRQAILEKVNMLDLKHRLPIILKYFSGFSEKEISQVLGIPTTTVKARLYNARRKLKNNLIGMEVGVNYER